MTRDLNCEHASPCHPDGNTETTGSAYDNPAWRASTVMVMAEADVTVWRYPELIQRPVVIWADRAVIARPPELLLPLLEAGLGH
jgi:hypothetical protein